MRNNPLNKHLVCMLLLVGASGACTTDESSPVGAWTPARGEVVPFDSVFILDEVTALAATEADPIGQVSHFLVSSEYFIVLDQFATNIKQFDRRGRLLRTLGGAGEGPGEFRNPLRAVWLDDSTFAALDNRRRVLIAFDTSGVLVHELPAPEFSFFDMARVPDKGAIILSTIPMGVPGQHGLHEVDLQARPLDSYLDLQLAPLMWERVFTGVRLTVVGDVVVSGIPGSNALRLWERAKREERPVILAPDWYEPNEWPSDDMQMNRTGMEQWFRELLLLVRLIALDAARYAAAFRTEDPEGNLMFQYVVADTAGITLAITTPKRIELMQVLGSFAYGLHVGDDGRLAIHRFRVRPV